MAYTQDSKHYGQVVEHAVRRSNMSITALARQLKVSRRSIYNWFTDDDLSFEIVARIGKALNYDFSSELPELQGAPFKASVERNTVESPEGNDLVYYWKEKYIALLEAHNQFLLSSSFPRTANYSSFQSPGFA